MNSLEVFFTMRQITLALIILALCATAPVEAQQIAHSQFFPVVARTAGVGGTQWLSDLTVVNLTDSELTVGTQFVIADQANIFDPTFPTRFTLAPRETRLIVDVINNLFGYETNIKGALLLMVDPSVITTNPEGSVILATTRTYNTGSSEGTFGQTVPALGWVINASGTPSYVTGAINDSRFRSNLGIVSLALFAEITVHYKVMDASGATVVEGSKTMLPSSMSQWSFADLGVPKADGPLTVELTLDPADVFPDPCATQFPNMFIAYVSKVDGNPDGTGDAEFIYAAPTETYDCPR